MESIKIDKDKIQIELEEKYQKKWNSKSLRDDKLKTIAKDLYNGDIYTDRHCMDHELTQRFMPLLFMGPGTNSSDDTSEKRDNLIYKLLEQEIETKYYQEYVSNIGLVFEYLDKRGPMALNGGPMFMSCRFLTRDDTKKMFEYYEKYKELRESVDNF